LSQSSSVDNRLFTIGTARPGRVRKQDIPDLASAIVGYFKGKAVLDAATIRNISYVRLHGANCDVLVTREDWVRILPKLQDGTIGSTFFPSPSFGFLDPTRSVTGQDYGDPTLYQRTFTTLSEIFSDAEAYPT
jgi:hypothetical protein